MFELKLWKIEVSRGQRIAVHYVLALASLTREEVHRKYLEQMPKGCGVKAALVVAGSENQTLGQVGF